MRKLGPKRQKGREEKERVRATGKESGIERETRTEGQVVREKVNQARN